MAKRDLEDTPKAKEEGSTEGVAPKLTAFAKQLRKRYGAEIDPDISLDPDFAKEASGDAPLEKGDTPAKQRLSRLSNLTPGDFRYKYKEEIGRGGMGVVYRAHHRRLDPLNRQHDRNAGILGGSTLRCAPVKQPGFGVFFAAVFPGGKGDGFGRSAHKDIVVGVNRLDQHARRHAKLHIAKRRFSGKQTDRQPQSLVRVFQSHQAKGRWRLQRGDVGHWKPRSIGDGQINLLIAVLHAIRIDPRCEDRRLRSPIMTPVGETIRSTEGAVVGR